MIHNFLINNKSKKSIDEELDKNNYSNNINKIQNENITEFNNNNNLLINKQKNINKNNITNTNNNFIQDNINHDNYDNNLTQFNDMINNSNDNNRSFYDLKWYPNFNLQANVIGCGARNTPCLGGTQIPIANPPSSIVVDDSNIAPNNIRVLTPIVEQQIGVLYQIFGRNNQILPLYGRKIFPYGDKWVFHTFLDGVKMQLITRHNNNNMLGNNDVVFLRGINDRAYRVTIYDNNEPLFVRNY